MTSDSIVDKVEKQLLHQGFEITRDGDSLELNKPETAGRDARTTRVDPTEFMSATRSNDPERLTNRVEGFVRGIRHALLDPKKSGDGDWTFRKAAGRLVPSIELPAFGQGVKAVEGQPTWSKSFPDGLQIQYFIELDRGLRVLTAPQVEAWGVTEDRIDSAARSVLYHKTQNESFESHESAESVKTVDIGDGFNAARSLIILDLYYLELSRDVHFAVPTPNDLLFTTDDSDEAVQTLSQIAEQTYRREDEGLSPTLFTYDKGNPVEAE